MSSIPRRAAAAPTNKRVNVHADLEDDCGFKFRRVSKSVLPASPIARDSPLRPKATAVPSKPTALIASENAPNASQKLKNGRRRRSSFAAIAARSGTPRQSSFSVSLSQKLPPSSVSTREFYKHLLPDLPGPVKMRQLMIWAVQKVRSNQRDEKGMEDLVQSVLQGLFTNKINTSWYQRPSSGPAVVSDGEKITERGPKNQELMDCIQLYERYNQKLRAELSAWTRIKDDPNLFVPDLSMVGKDTPVSSPSLFDHELRRAIESGSRWFSSLPETVDHMKWTLNLTSSFENHARAYCEAVFHQISARLFGGNVRPEPMLLLRALSTCGGPAN